MNARWLTLHCALALVVACTSCSRPEQEVKPLQTLAAETEGGLSIAELAGTWVAEMSHGGTTERFWLELRPNESGTVMRAHVSIPAIDLREYGIGAVSVVDDGLRAGPLELRYDPDGPRLVGTVPEGLVPNQTIALDLRRGDPFEPPADPPELPAPELLWTFETGGPIWAGVSAAEGAIFAGSDDGNVYALDRNGGERWRFTTAAAVRAAPTIGGATGSVLVHSDDGTLYRLSIDSGELVWKSRVGDPIHRGGFGTAEYRYDHYGSAATISGGHVFVGHARDVHALDLETGDVLWSRALEDQTTSSPVVWNDRVYLGSFDGNVYALDAASGDVVWTHDTGAPVPSSVALYGRGDGALAIVGSRSYELLGLDASDGSRVWSNYYWFSWVESSPVIFGDTVYVGSSDSQKLNAIEARSGALTWSFDTGGSAWASPAVSDDAVYMGAVGVAGYLVDHQGGFFAVDRQTGEGVWHHPSPVPEGAALWGFGASPAVFDGIVVAGSLDGNLYAFPVR